MDVSNEDASSSSAYDNYDWHALGHGDVFKALSANVKGLSSDEATGRLEEFGPNAIPKGEPTPAWKIFGRQFCDLLILILVIAAAVSLFVEDGGWKDAVVIMAIVIINAFLGFFQEYKAEKALHALRAMLSSTARALRDGRQVKLDADDIVPGDVILLEAGDKVPADAYLIESINCHTDEAALTGESHPVEKSCGILSEDVALADRNNILFSGTTVVNGTAKAVVVATGLNTEFGKIARMTGEVEKDTSPLKAKMSRLGKQVGVITLVICLLIVLLGVIQQRPLVEMFMIGVSLAVAVIPEGLPAVVTITLALGLRRMLERNCLIRRLTANEALGSTSVICTDKTGTLTRNEMTVTHVLLPDGSDIAVGGVGYEPTGQFSIGGAPLKDNAGDYLREALKTALLCNHAELRHDEEKGGWSILGDPTEGALVVAALKAGLKDIRSGAGEMKETEFSFSSERKRMTVVYREEGRRIAHAKGAPEIILERCNRTFIGGEEVELDEAMRSDIMDSINKMAGSGLRVLALARRELANNERHEHEVERNFVFMGLFGIVDPPRPEVKGAVNLAKRAGIEVVIITGDNPLTAQAVAENIGVRVDRVYVGSEIGKMDKEELMKALEQPFVIFARVSSEHKLRIIDALKGMDKVIAMTGDGVNDAPALKRADVGIAMGIKGTDVAREASDVVLLDDNFASIVNGVEEGRRQYDNIQKFTRLMFSSNFGEIVAIGCALIARFPLLLVPVQILWVNIVTDGLPALALGLEPSEPDAMERDPRHPRSSILSKEVMLLLLGIGLYEGVATYLLFRWGIDKYGAESEEGLMHARTLAFTGLIVFQMLNVFNFRSLRFPLYKIGLFSNPLLLVAVCGSILLQIGVVYTPLMQDFLHAVPLVWTDWILMIIAGMPIFLVVEAFKIGMNIKKRSQTLKAGASDESMSDI